MTADLVGRTRENLADLGKAAPFVLGEHTPPIDEDVELASPPRRHLRVDAECVGELGRETRGPYVVAASGRAEEDFDAHHGTLAHSDIHGPTPPIRSTAMRTTWPAGGFSIGGKVTSGPR